MKAKITKTLISDENKEFKIGNERMYKLKDLTEFYDRMKTGEKYKYGNKLEFVHQKQNFAEQDQQLLEFILKQSEIIRFNIFIQIMIFINYLKNKT